MTNKEKREAYTQEREEAKKKMVSALWEVVGDKTITASEKLEALKMLRDLLDIH